MAIAVSESSEHVADGNVHQVTNDTYNTSRTFTLSHTVDTAAADAMVNNLYETALGRAVDPSGLSTFAGALLNGTMTQAQIATSLITSSEFATKYGTMANADFVSQMFANSLGRLPTTAEAQKWFVQSGNNLQIDVMGTANQVTVANFFASSTNTSVTAGGLKVDTQIAQLVQAMATYSAGHAGFNPAAVAQAPNDTTLQSAITAAWHH